MKILNFVLVLACFTTAFDAYGSTFNARDCGAMGDGAQLDTKAIQTAIDKCAEAGFPWASSRAQVNVLDFGVGTLVRQFDFLGVEGEHVFEFAPVGQAQVHALIAHAGLRQLEQPVGPALFESDSHAHSSGIFSGPVTVPGCVPAVKMTSTPPPGWP